MVSISFVVDVKGCVSDQTRYFVANSSVTWSNQANLTFMLHFSLSCVFLVLQGFFSQSYKICSGVLMDLQLKTIESIVMHYKCCFPTVIVN